MEQLSHRQLNSVIANYVIGSEGTFDKDITLTVVKADAMKLEYSSKELQDDEEVVTTALTKDGRALRFASLRLRSLENTVYIAVNNFTGSVVFAEGEALKSRKIALLIASRGAVEYLPKWAFSDEEIADITCKRNPKALKYFSEEIRSNAKIVLNAVKADRTSVIYGQGDAFKNDELFYIAVKPQGDYVGLNTVTFDTPYGVFKEIERRGLKVNLAMQNFDALKCDRDSLLILLRCFTGTVLKKNELLAKYVLEDDRDVVKMLIDSGLVTRQMATEQAKIASLNRKMRVLPLLIAHTRQVKQLPKLDDRTLIIRSLKRNSPLAVRRVLDALDEYIYDDEILLLALGVNGNILPEIVIKRGSVDERFIDTALSSYVVKNSDMPFLSRLQGVTLTLRQAKLAYKKDFRNYEYLSEEYKEILKND